MPARALCTGMIVVLAIGGFLGAGPAPAGVNAPGIILLVGAVLVWFAWPAGYSYRSCERRRPDLMTIGGAPLLKGRERRG
jgi:hypothetical protein